MIKRLGTAWWLKVANRHWLSTSRCRGFLSHGGTSKIIHVIFGFFHSKPSILGYHHFRKPLKIFQVLVGLGFRSQWSWCGLLNLKVDAFSAITKGSWEATNQHCQAVPRGVSARVKMVEGFVAGLKQWKRQAKWCVVQRCSVQAISKCCSCFEYVPTVTPIMAHMLVNIP